ncbi:DUF2461 domain-containing protein [Bauldia sp.]|uniref:DUF2461 domain-containing protein n=1 Tax=Bauldia sp. TaxID=2575872 RepID=UPI003BAB12C9
MNKGPRKLHLSPDLPGFLDQLAKNNNKEWFEAHRDLYKAAFVEPTLAFIEAMAPPLAKLEPPLQAVPKVNGSLRRINRDVRFSKDKRPYSNSLHLVFWAGDHPNRSPGFHISLSADHWGYGAGHWAFEPAQLDAYRDAVTSGSGAKDLLAALAKAEKDGATIGEPQLARVPRGFEVDEPVATLLRRKGIVVMSGHQPMVKGLFSAKAVDTVMTHVKASMPLIRWLDRNVFA